jgi:hypothetical protein
MGTFICSGNFKNLQYLVHNLKKSPTPAELPLPLLSWG